MYRPRVSSTPKYTLVIEVITKGVRPARVRSKWTLYLPDGRTDHNSIEDDNGEWARTEGLARAKLHAGGALADDDVVVRFATPPIPPSR